MTVPLSGLQRWQWGAAAGLLETVWLAVALVLTASAPARADPTFPKLTGQVVDEMGLLRPEDRAAILTELKALEGKSSDQVVVAVVRSLQGYPIEDYGYRLGRAWGIGQSTTNNGVILLVAPTERRVRIEVGRGLEPQLTDALSRTIIENAITPAFKRGDYAAGIRAGVKDITDVLLGDAEEVRKRIAQRPVKAPDVDYVSLAFLALWIGMFLFIMWRNYKQSQQLPPGARRSQRNGRDVTVLPLSLIHI